MLKEERERLAMDIQKQIAQILADAHMRGMAIGVRFKHNRSNGLLADKKALRRDMKRIGHDFKRAIRKVTV